MIYLLYFFQIKVTGDQLQMMEDILVAVEVENISAVVGAENIEAREGAPQVEEIQADSLGEG